MLPAPTPAPGVASLADARRLYPPPGNRRAYLHQPGDDCIVAARPDLKFQVYRATAGRPYYRTGFGFVLLQGTRPPVPFDFDRVEQRFELGCLPLLSQRVTQDGFDFVLDSFTTQDAAGRSLIRLRLTVWRRRNVPDAIEVGWLATRARQQAFVSHANEDYIEFEPSGPAWESRLPLQHSANSLHDGTCLFCAWQHSGGVTVHPPASGSSMQLVFRAAPSRQQPETIELAVPYESLSQPADAKDTTLAFCATKSFRPEEPAQLLATPFETDRLCQMQAWSARLARGTRILVPESAVQDVYRTLTLNNLQFLGSAPEAAWLKPGQGGYNDFSTVYAWEASHFLTILAQQGYREEVSRVLDFLLTTQHGHKGPEGDVSDAEGAFRPHIHWMNETGAVLEIFAAYAFASGDFARLQRGADALLQAARWIQRQRNRTRESGLDGHQLPHYGLMPKGRPHDWPIFGYFLFTDTNLWRGMDALARAFAAAGLPDAAWLRQEADDYRQCILKAVRQACKPHPLDPNCTWVPSEIYEDPTGASQTSIYCGPQSLLATGILDASDPLIPVMEAMLRRSGCLNDRFGFQMRLMEDEQLRQRQLAAAGGAVDLYYVTNMEQSWHRLWLERGERAKAIAYFYMTLAYSVSRDLHLAQERFCPQLPWLLPWQPNASANGRILSMILTSLCFRKDDTCHLLYGVPDAWFAAGSPLGVEGLWMGGGSLSFRLELQAGKPGWLFSYTCRSIPPPRWFVLFLPDGAGTGRTYRKIPCAGASGGPIEVV